MKFLTAGNAEFKADHRVKAVVWLELVPTARHIGADEALGDAGLHTNTGNKQSGQRCANCAPGLESDWATPRTVDSGERHQQDDYLSDARRGGAEKIRRRNVRGQRTASPAGGEGQPSTRKRTKMPPGFNTLGISVLLPLVRGLRRATPYLKAERAGGMCPEVCIQPQASPQQCERGGQRLNEPSFCH